MKVNIYYCPISDYNKTNITQWAFMFRRYKFINGFVMRVFGIYINIREKNATQKLLKPQTP